MLCCITTAVDGACELCLSVSQFFPAAENVGVVTLGRVLFTHRDIIGVDRNVQGYDQCYVRM